jgi:hypothetical protein
VAGFIWTVKQVLTTTISRSKEARILPVNRVLSAIAIVLAMTAIAPAQEVNRDARAYAFAKREAQMQAAREQCGHLLGIAPGCRFAGVGMSRSTNQPRHCSTSNLRLVARAYAIGRSGKVYWSAHYR